jgi:hypothetical protein
MTTICVFQSDNSVSSSTSTQRRPHLMHLSILLVSATTVVKLQTIRIAVSWLPFLRISIVRKSSMTNTNSHLLAPIMPLLTKSMKSILNLSQSCLFILVLKSLGCMQMPILPRIIMRHSIRLRLFYQLNRTVQEVVVVNPLMKSSKN